MPLKNVIKTAIFMNPFLLEFNGTNLQNTFKNMTFQTHNL